MQNAAVYALQGQGPAAELIDHVKHISAAAADLTARRPEEWRPWVEGVIELVRQKGTVDPEALADAFRNGPIPPNSTLIFEIEVTTVE